MAKSIKAALLSGLVFPGLGQLSQKHYKRGVAIVIVTTISLAVIVSQIIEQVKILAKELQTNGEVSHIMDASVKMAAALDNSLFTGCEYLLGICWVVSIVDAYVSEKDVELPKQQGNTEEG